MNFTVYELYLNFLKVGHIEELVLESDLFRNILGEKKPPEAMLSDFGTVVPSCYHVIS